MATREPTPGLAGGGAVSPDQAEAWHRKALRLEYATIAWNSAEAVITLVLGFMARSLALIAFGLDSIVELFASVVVVWHMRDSARANHADRTRLALRLVSVAFFGLAVFLAIASIWSLVTAARPDESPVGIVYLALTAVVISPLPGSREQWLDSSTPVCLRLKRTSRCSTDSLLQLFCWPWYRTPPSTGGGRTRARR